MEATKGIQSLVAVLRNSSFQDFSGPPQMEHEREVLEEPRTIYESGQEKGRVAVRNDQGVDEGSGRM